MKRARPEMQSTVPVEMWLPGEPVAKGRPRMTRSGRTYTPTRTRKYEAALQKVARIAMAGRAPLVGPLYVNIAAVFAIPRSASKRQREAMRDTAVIKRPDLDNIIKIAFDGISGIVFRDDAEVARVWALKRYGEEPGLDIEVWPDV